MIYLASNYNKSLLDKYGVEYLYHMTHIDNLSSIIKYGLYAHGNGYQSKDISDHDVNDRRSLQEPIYHLPIHSYVPFYLNPKNAMLYRRRNIQDKIVILGINRDLIFSKQAIFTDGNAACQSTKFYNNISDIKNLDWDCLHAERWSDIFDGRRTRMAEVLIPDHVSVNEIEVVFCNDIWLKSRIENMTTISVKQTNEFYF